MKYNDGLNIALIEIDIMGDDTDITEEQVRAWNDFDLYEWLETLGYNWNGEGWAMDGED